MMSVTITVEDAQANLQKLINQMAPGDEVTITENETSGGQAHSHAQS
jgi:antitoxin (DNA-binding transcriptional repressor) of toxin-antitoxin stability system